LKSIAVIGPNADNAWNLVGDYAPFPEHMASILDGIKAKVSPATRITYVQGCTILTPDRNGIPEAIAAAKQADVAIVVVGETSQRGSGEEHATDGEGYDVASLDLSGVQEDLVEAVYSTGTPTVVVLVNGRPLSVRWIAAHVPALVEAWEPGERGGEALPDVLFGDYNPSARLAITIPRSVGQLPAYYDYKPSKTYWIDRGWSDLKGYADMSAAPLYPFGYGLSYTHFEYSNLRIEPGEIHPGGEAQVTLDVKNTGAHAGVETVQLYLHEKYAPVSTPVKQLRGFGRVALQPGEMKPVTLNLTPEDLQLLDLDMQWRVVPGDFEIMVGESSADILLRGVLKVTP
jgi:beta-glucosidase